MVGNVARLGFLYYKGRVGGREARERWKPFQYSHIKKRSCLLFGWDLKRKHSRISLEEERGVIFIQGVIP